MPEKNDDTLTASKLVKLPDGTDLAYLEAGAGEQTLLFVHGLGTNKSAWQKNIAYLKNYYRCIAIDLPGYGASSQKDFSFSMDFFAQSLRDFAAALDLQNLILVGHSMGGQIAVTFALNFPGFLKKLVLIAPAGFEKFSEAEKIWFGGVYQPLLLKAASEEQIRQNFENNFFHFPNDAEQLITERMQLKKEAAAYDYYCRMIPKNVAAMLEAPIFDRLHLLRLPTLIFFGLNDALIPNPFLHPNQSTAEIARAGHLKIPGSQLTLLPDCGHFLNWEKADEVNRGIQHFLK